MRFPHGATVFRDRRAAIPDPYNPSKSTFGDWDPALTIALEGAFVASTSSTALSNATRKQILTAKSLYLTDPDADVVPEDRIRVGGTESDMASGTAYLIEARPDADTNPFTGWRPAVEIPLTLPEG